MDTENIIQSAELLVQQIADYPQEVLAALSIDQRSTLLAKLDELANQAASVRSRQDLAVVADEILCLLESQSTLHPLFFGESQDLTAVQQQRKISIADHTATAAGDTQAQVHAVQLRNTILECREQLQGALGKTDTSTKATK